MKPTFPTGRTAPHSDSSRPFGQHYTHAPQPECRFQLGTPHLGSGSCATVRHPGAKLPLAPAFRSLSDGFFAREAKTESRLEGVLFAIIAALAAWPIVLAAQAAATFVR